MKNKLPVLLGCLLFYCTLLKAQSGILDTSFNHSGRVSTDFNSSDEEAFATAIQADGKIIVAGYTLCCSNAEDFAMVRYNVDGSIDNTFGVNGKVITDFAGAFVASDIAHAIAIQADGKIILGGQQFNPTVGQPFNSKNNFALARYTANGVLDASFGTGGLVKTDFGGPYESNIRALLLQPDGLIIAAGVVDSLNTTGGITPSDFALARYTTNGNLDISFGTNGLVKTNVGGADQINALQLLSNGQLIAAGFLRNSAYDDSIVIVKYNSNGSIDNTFANNGVCTQLIGSTSGAEDLAIQADGKIVVVGGTNLGSHSIFYVARFTANGLYDASFGTNGITTTDFQTGKECYARAVVIQSDGKIILGGTANKPYLTTLSNNDFALARYTTNGVLDSGFALNGLDTTDFSPNSNTHFADYGYDLALQADGKIICAGTSAMSFAAARYTNSIAINNIEELSNNDLISIYPNPCTAEFTIDCTIPKNANVCMYDMLGKLVYQLETTASKTIFNTGNLTTGIYYLTIQSDAAQQTYKVIKQ